ncbi:hypothetical protein E2C01_036928 [Portunus trituberculatus]|uniref:Uncharacterized protein n=1 Tax=Portunus trituberculatus TaxID=210409 RepID=A0A5B7FCR1_PORTR|nr:hypothetical protein [Portunus trituberculatus]
MVQEAPEHPMGFTSRGASLDTLYKATTTKTYRANMQHNDSDLHHNHTYMEDYICHQNSDPH